MGLGLKAREYSYLVLGYTALGVQRILKIRSGEFLPMFDEALTHTHLVQVGKAETTEREPSVAVAV